MPCPRDSLRGSSVNEATGRILPMAVLSWVCLFCLCLFVLSFAFVCFCLFGPADSGGEVVAMP